MQPITNINNYDLKAIDFFCGAGGMTNGFIQAGINVIAGLDIDANCKNTYEKNNSPAKFIEADITNLTEEELGRLTCIKRNDDNLIFIGCSPCQYWTKVQTIKESSAKSKNLLKDFQRFVTYFNPGFVVIENVPGILTNEKETPLKDFIKLLELKGYVVDKGIINAKFFGIPQSRRRFLLIASRVSQNVYLPKEDKSIIKFVKDCISVENGFPPIEAGHKDETTFLHSAANLSDKNKSRLALTPKNGGTRKAWKDSNDLQIEAYQNKDKIFADIYGRMYWDRPSPTITTKFHSISNGRFAHPEQDRGISLREGAVLQSFPLSYQFYGTSFASIARQIGNAVPPLLAYHIGTTILDLLNTQWQFSEPKQGQLNFSEKVK